MNSEEFAQRRRSSDLEKILTVAAERLADHGYNATSLADIAILGEMEPSVVTFHFPSREDLVDAVLRAGISDATDAIRSALDDLPDEASGATRLTAAMSAYLTEVNANRHMTRANVRCYQSVPRVVRRALRVYMADFVSLWETLIRDGQADGTIRNDVDPPAAARMVIAALNSSVTWMPNDPGGNVLRQFPAMLMSGLEER